MGEVKGEDRGNIKEDRREGQEGKEEGMVE